MTFYGEPVFYVVGLSIFIFTIDTLYDFKLWRLTNELASILKKHSPESKFFKYYLGKPKSFPKSKYFFLRRPILWVNYKNNLSILVPFALALDIKNLRMERKRVEDIYDPIYDFNNLRKLKNNEINLELDDIADVLKIQLFLSTFIIYILLTFAVVVLVFGFKE